MYLDDLEQVKALAMPIRVEILRIMDGKPMTTSQICRVMKQSQGKLYYHITEMERVGILSVTETRMKGNLIEKYYLPAARYFRINPLLFQSGNSGKQIFVDTVSSQFESTLLDIRRHIDDGTLNTELIDKSVSSMIEGKLTVEEARKLSEELRELVMKHGVAGGKGPVMMHFMSVFYLTKNVDGELEEKEEA